MNIGTRVTVSEKAYLLHNQKSGSVIGTTLSNGMTISHIRFGQTDKWVVDDLLSVDTTKPCPKCDGEGCVPDFDDFQECPLCKGNQKIDADANDMDFFVEYERPPTRGLFFKIITAKTQQEALSLFYIHCRKAKIRKIETCFEQLPIHPSALDEIKGHLRNIANLPALGETTYDDVIEWAKKKIEELD